MFEQMRRLAANGRGLPAPHSARAATLTVNDTGDSGPGTLRDALVSAADGDTIDATGVSGTIFLTNGELLVARSVTILGPGPANLVVDGNAASRVLHVASNAVVSISSLTVTNGQGYAPGQKAASAANLDQYMAALKVK